MSNQLADRLRMSLLWAAVLPCVGFGVWIGVTAMHPNHLPSGEQTKQEERRALYQHTEKVFWRAYPAGLLFVLAGGVFLARGAWLTWKLSPSLRAWAIGAWLVLLLWGFGYLHVIAFAFGWLAFRHG